MLNAIRTVINPQVPIEAAPKGTAKELSEYLARMFRHCSNALRNIYTWQKTHLLPVADSHPQYWHKEKSIARAGLYFSNLEVPQLLLHKVVNYTGSSIPSHLLETDLINGTITIKPEHAGLYELHLSGYVSGGLKSTYVVTVFLDGKPTLLRCYGASKGGLISGFALLDLPGGVLDVRLEHPSTGSLMVYDLNFYLIRCGEGGTSLSVVPKKIPAGWSM